MDILRRVLGQKDLFTVGTPAAETKVHDPKTQSTWSRMWGTAVRYTKQSANYVAKTAASQLPDGVAGKVNGVITQMLDFKRLLRGSCRGWRTRRRRRASCGCCTSCGMRC
ncbi:hypothetical protein ABL840_25445 [Variovorax sp. NFACC27]|uniref:hypothetical protein n=1 Tax=Variovorax sp. NFACC27 TaxID=1566274 RepID=UPI003AAE2DC7